MSDLINRMHRVSRKKGVSHFTGHGTGSPGDKEQAHHPSETDTSKGLGVEMDFRLLLTPKARKWLPLNSDKRFSMYNSIPT